MHNRQPFPFRRAFWPSLALLALLSGCAGVPPRPRAAVPPALPGMATFHVVVKGETLWRIAHDYGVDMNALKAANGISDATRIEAGRRLVIPGVSGRPVVATPGMSEAEIGSLVGFPDRRVPWRTITIHHSATRYGNGKVFDRYHRKRGMNGLFYHFLIGNGNGLDDGQIEVGWRWKQQAEVNRPQDIQICLVGNFTRQQVTARQYESLKRLIAVLRRRYGITCPVRRHCDVAARPTRCPGELFPYSRLVNDTRNGS